MRAALRRVQRLETLAPPKVAPVLERFGEALDEAAHRLMGASYDSFKHDSVAQDRIHADVRTTFCHRLNHADEDRLIADLERIAGVSVDDVIIPAASAADAVFGG